MNELSDWGTPATRSEHIVDVVVEMINRDSTQLLGNKSDVHWGEIDTISEAVEEACIRLGLSTDDFSPSLNVDGYEYEITLYG